MTHDVLVEEARFILRTLQRADLFGDRVRLTEAERVLDTSISLSFGDYCAFLNKYGYIRLDQLANIIEVTEGGVHVAQNLNDAEFHARLSRHFAKELQGSGPPSLSDTAVAAAAEPVTVNAPRTVRPIALAADDVLDRRYRKGEILGQGTLGTVYVGSHVNISRPLAIKEARAVFQYASYLRRDEIVRRIKRTVEVQACLSHPGIVQVVDQNTEREFPYFVTELGTGGSLRDRLMVSEEGCLELHLAIRVLVQLCYALDYAHEQGILHTGLKPENVVFDGQGNAKLSDFGVARITDRPDDSVPSHILVGGGTVGYMAPELLQPGTNGNRALSAAADIYSLGMLFYEMITGKLPGRRSPLPSQARDDVPNAFDEVFDRMTRDELGERYENMQDVLDGLYEAFPSEEVFKMGSIIMWSRDPNPIPEPEPEMIEEPDAIEEVDASEVEQEMPLVRAVPDESEVSELK
ncbi:MAG: serine/threonine-protein kinase, partial [Myxococcota bacterium]